MKNIASLLLLSLITPAFAEVKIVKLAKGQSSIMCRDGDSLLEAVRNLNTGLSSGGKIYTFGEEYRSNNPFQIDVGESYSVSAPEIILIPKEPAIGTVMACVTLTKL